MSAPEAPSGIRDSLSRLSTAVDQHLQGVTGDQSSPWTRAANTPNAMLGVGQQYAQSVGKTVDAWKNLTAPAKPGDPPPTKTQVAARAIRATQQTVGAILGGLTLIKSALDGGFANLTAPIAAIFPSLPAATIGSPYIGTPHAHVAHPPSGPPPVPPTPMPSIGAVTLGVSTRVLINSMPAARVEDIGLAPTCCGLPVAWFKIKTGSSNVFIGGVRAARTTDICKACPVIPEKPSIPAGKMMAAIGKAAGVASKVMQYGGMAAGALTYAADMAEAAVEDDAAMAAGKALDAATTAAQMAMDLAKMQVEAMMWKDVPVLPPTGSIGAIVDPTHLNVLIGGFPMINIPDPVSALLNRLSRYKAASPPENTGCGEEGEPVDVVTGANLEESLDFPICAELSLSWQRYYDSSLRNVRGILGWGWRYEFQGELRFDVDGILFLPGKGQPVAFPNLVRDGDSAGSSGFLLRRTNETTYQLKRSGEPTKEFSISAKTGIGRLARVFNRARTAQFAYDNEHRITRIRRSASTDLDFKYDSRGLLIRILEREERLQPQSVVIYEYDRNENLIAWTDACGDRATLEYDDQHRLVRKGDRRNYSYYYSYDKLSRCVHTWGEDGMYEVQLEYLQELRCTKATHGDGGVWTFFYDENGTITKILDPYGKSRERIVNRLGRVVSEIDAAGNLYRLLYDAHGGLIGRRDPFGHINRKLADQRAHNHQPLIAPDNPLEWEYGSLLSPKEIHARFQGVGSSPAARTTDALGRKIEERVDTNNERRWTYDGNGNVLKYEDADASIHRFDIASWNLVHREIDPLGNATKYAYTARERIRQVVDPGGTTSDYTYDLRDNIVRVVRNGRLREEYVRDGTDNLIEKRDSSGRTVLRFEIGQGNLVKVRQLSSGENHYFEYDESARIIKAATDSSETFFEYGLGRRSISDIRGGEGIRYQFVDLDFTRLVVLKRFDIHYRRDQDTLVITDPTGTRHRIEIDRSGKVVLELSHDVTETSRYDSNGRCLSKIRSSSGNNWAAWKREYSYSSEGDLVTVDDNRFGNFHYRYDAAHRLIAEVRADGSRFEYHLDPAGNLLEKPGLSGVSIEKGNRLASANGATVVYNDRDHIACLEKDERTTRFEYDSCDRLIRCTTPSGEWRSNYDPLGRRTEKIWNGSVIEYFWDHNRLIAERRNGGPLRIYIYADVEAIVPFMFVDYESQSASPDSGRRYFIVTNQIGTPIRIEDESGHTVWQAKVNPYGTTEVLPGKKIDFALRFPGHQEDHEIGLFYNRFRHYSPALGRYLQSDPLGIAGGKNLYAYPANPLTTVDIFGLTGHLPKGGKKGGGSTKGSDDEETAPAENDEGWNPKPRQPKTDPAKYEDDLTELEQKDRDEDTAIGTRIYTDEERDKFRVVANDDGQLVWNDTGEPVHTEDGKEPHIYVMDGDGNVYVHPDGEDENGNPIRHSSLAADEPVASAGNIKVDQGKPTEADDFSGHYGRNLPDTAPKNVNQSLTDQGVKTDALKTPQTGV
jgi:RHS repeat-associated protein